MIAALAPALAGVVCTEIPPAALAATAAPAPARARPRELADLCAGPRPRGERRAATSTPPCAAPRETRLRDAPASSSITGSHYLIGPARAAQGALTVDPGRWLRH